MRYEAQGTEVRMVTFPPEYEISTVVATCFTEGWATVIAGLLQADWESDSPREAKADVHHGR